MKENNSHAPGNTIKWHNYAQHLRIYIINFPGFEPQQCPTLNLDFLKGELQSVNRKHPECPNSDPFRYTLQWQDLFCHFGRKNCLTKDEECVFLITELSSLKSLFLRKFVTGGFNTFDVRYTST